MGPSLEEDNKQEKKKKPVDILIASQGRLCSGSSPFGQPLRHCAIAPLQHWATAPFGQCVSARLLLGLGKDPTFVCCLWAKVAEQQVGANCRKRSEFLRLLGGSSALNQKVAEGKKREKYERNKKRY